MGSHEFLVCFYIISGAGRPRAGSDGASLARAYAWREAEGLRDGKDQGGCAPLWRGFCRAFVPRVVRA
eukprot:10898697-Lingulodinium_polyedra.AAC.1